MKRHYYDALPSDKAKSCVQEGTPFDM